MENSIICLDLYRTGNPGWAFDDSRTGLVGEPFVSGIPAIIDWIEKDALNRVPKTLRVYFSLNAFPGAPYQLNWESSDSGGNWYTFDADGKEMRGWLCPALYKYFTAAPKAIYVAVEPIS